MIRLFSRFVQKTHGVAATEFVLWLSILVFPLLNVVDLSFYTFQSMQVDSASQAAVQAAWKQCDYTAISSPLVKSCLNDSGGNPILLPKMQAAAQSLTLGVGITLASSDVKEAYLCSNGSSVLKDAGNGGEPNWQLPNNIGTRPATCAKALSGSSVVPGDYIQATVHYTYTPIFPYASIVSLLPTAMTKTAILRLDGGS